DLVLPTALHQQLAGADYVAVSCALTDETRHLFGAEAFRAMKRGSYLSNVTRGEIVDTGALLLALDEERIAGAGLDAVEPEPLPAGHPLWQKESVILTPH